MDKVHRELIQLNYLQLSKALRPDVLTVVKYLQQANLISDTMAEDIEYQQRPTERAYKLLDIMPTRGPKAFGIFYKAVLEAELWDAADLLEPSNAPHGNPKEVTPSSSSSSATTPEIVEEDKPLPDNWPTEAHLLDVIDQRLTVTVVEECHTLMRRRFFNPNEKQEYALNQKSKGRVLIINNEIFTQGLTDRMGSSQDQKGLNCVFNRLNFDVCINQDKTREEMEKIIDRECCRNFKDIGCFILIILSHGVRGKVFGTDGIPPRESTQMTSTDNSIEIENIKQRIAGIDTLKGKPKIFIIQACQTDYARTSNHESMVEESSTPNNDSSNQQGNLPLNPINFPGIKNKTPQVSGPCPADGNDGEDVELNSMQEDHVDSDETLVKTIDDGSDVVDGNGSNKDKGSLATDATGTNSSQSIPDGADIFTALATIEGQPSFRNTAFGSWFIQAFIYVLANYAHKHELAGLMKKVTQLLMKARSRNDESQVCETRSTLNKDFYFFPGLCPD